MQGWEVMCEYWVVQFDEAKPSEKEFNVLNFLEQNAKFKYPQINSEESKIQKVQKHVWKIASLATAGFSEVWGRELHRGLGREQHCANF